MPCCVFHIRPVAPAERRAECAAFGEASATTKSLRAGLSAGRGRRIRKRFAETEAQAVDRLCQPRAAGPYGDE